MRTVLAAAAAAFVLSAAPATAQGDQAMKAFEHYEAIRVALAADTITDVAMHATALAMLAEAMGYAAAQKAAEGVGAATNIKHAREHFGALSAALIPKFEKVALKDVHFFTCSMVKQSWAQRGREVQNPYMGKAMLACGAPAKPSK